MGMNWSYNPIPDRKEVISLLRVAVDRGVTFFHTAEVYGTCTNEELMDEALSPFRGQIATASKFGYQLKSDRVPVGSAWIAARSRSSSLSRAHSSGSGSIEAVAGTVKYLIQQGQVKHFGMCEAAAKTIRCAHAVQPVTVVPSGYSLWFRDPEKEVPPILEEPGIGFVPFSPLGTGFLTGKIDETPAFDSSNFRNTVPRFTPEVRKANLALVDLLDKIAERKKATPGQIALAWLVALKPWIAPILGTTTPRRKHRSGCSRTYVGRSS